MGSQKLRFVLEKCFHFNNIVFVSLMYFVMIMILVSLINVILEFKIVYINYHNSQYHTHTMYIFYEICSIFFIAIILM